MERSVCEQLLGQLEKRLLAECFVSEKLLTPEQAAEINGLKKSLKFLNNTVLMADADMITE